MALEAEGSSPFTHPLLGYRQAVRHKILILAYAGSSPAAVAKRNINCGGEIGKRLDTGRSDTARLCGGRPLMQTI